MIDSLPHVGEDVVGILLIPIVSYIVKVLIYPSNKEAKNIARLLTFFVVLLIKVIRKWYVGHRLELHDSLDKMLRHSHDLKARLKSGTIIQG